MLHWIATITAVLVVGLLALSRRIHVLDARPGGGAFEINVKPIFMVALAVGAVLAWRWEIVGGVIAAFSAAGLSAFALGLLEPSSAALVIIGFAVPGALWVLLDLHDRRPRTAIAALVPVALVVSTGAVLSNQIYDHIFGPSHPPSDTEALPDSVLDWVWSGGVTAHEAVVVAKVEEHANLLRLVVSESAELSDATPGPVEEPDDDGVVRMPVGGLRAATEYHYAVEVDGERDLVRAGRFRTFPDDARSFTVAFGGCARVGSNGSVFDAIRELDPSLFIINGDWYYANLTDDDEGDFREVYDFTLARPAQAALFRNTPIAYIWDDHDYGANNADRTSTTRAAALAVYHEYVPHYPVSGDDTPINQAFTIGRVRFLLTDTRSARSPTSDVDDANKTMLGEEQKAWLKREMLDARDQNALTVWVNPDPWVGATTPGSDTWSGYSTERRELADFIATNHIDRLVMLSGDAHMVALDDGTNTDYSTNGGAGFPLLHGAALDRRGKIKGGPYSDGAIGGGGQFGLIEVEDRGSSLQVVLSGRNWRDEVLLSRTFTF